MQVLQQSFQLGLEDSHHIEMWSLCMQRMLFDQEPRRKPITVRKDHLMQGRWDLKCC
jgi:hypothetical protein